MPTVLSRNIPVALIALGAWALSGCQWLAMANERVNGKEVTAQYKGLENHSAAIVVYADRATQWEYPAAREEVAAFVASKLRTDMPTVRLLDYRDVINFQDSTLNWDSLPVKDLGKHFGVDRVVYVELLQYSAREPGSSDLLRGRIKANCSVYETDTGSDSPAWGTTEFDETWPKQAPEDVLKSNELIVRKRVLELFAEDLTNRFYDHKDMPKSIREE